MDRTELLSSVEITSYNGRHITEARQALSYAFAGLDDWLTKIDVSTPLDRVVPNTLTLASNSQMANKEETGSYRAFSTEDENTRARKIYLNIDLMPVGRYVDALNHELWHLASVGRKGFDSDGKLTGLNECAIAFLTHKSVPIPSEVMLSEAKELLIGAALSDAMGGRPFVEAYLAGDYLALRSALGQKYGDDTVSQLEEALEKPENPEGLKKACELLGLDE